jgi:phage baseplate assembly protein W
MKYINIKFPLEDDPINNFFLGRNRTTKEALVSNLNLLLLTNKWERYFNPLYGSDLLRFIFEPNDSNVRDQLDREIKDMVKRFIPQLSIENIDFRVPETEVEHKLEIIINFTFTDDVFVERDTIQINL